jgi:uncharacterized protein
MTKHPAPGRVKTRLAAALGPERAAALYEAFVLDLAERLAPLGWPVTWAYWPREAPFASILPGARCRAQEGRDLGERMSHAIAVELADGAGSVVVIGADAPHLDTSLLGEAAERLADDADLVLGPADDGGYYLIGLKAPAPALFAGIAWSTSGVLAATLARARVLGLQVHLLAPGFDVDEPADLERLRALLAVGAVRLPRTAGVLGPP